MFPDIVSQHCVPTLYHEYHESGTRLIQVLALFIDTSRIDSYKNARDVGEGSYYLTANEGVRTVSALGRCCVCEKLKKETLRKL